MLLAFVVLCLVCLALSIEIGKENTYQVTYFCRVRLILILISTAALTKITQTSSIILESCTVHSRIFVVGEYPMLHFSQSVFIIIDILSGISAGAKKCSKSDFTDVHGTDNVTYSCELHCNRVPSFGMTGDARPSRLPKSIYTVPIRAQNLNFKNEIISIEF